MKETSNRYAVAALRERRASIDGEIKALEVQLRNLNEALCHLDATLSMFDPDYDPKTVRARRRYERQKLFGKGKLSRMILDTLRRAERPLAYREVIEAIAGEMGYGAKPPAAIVGNVRAGLRYLAKRGTVAREGDRKAARWRIAGSAS
jgi:hypothetical protein